MRTLRPWQQTSKPREFTHTERVGLALKYGPRKISSAPTRRSVKAQRFVAKRAVVRSLSLEKPGANYWISRRGIAHWHEPFEKISVR